MVSFYIYTQLRSSNFTYLPLRTILKILVYVCAFYMMFQMASKIAFWQPGSLPTEGHVSYLS